MNKTTYLLVLRLFFGFGAIYLMGEAVVHISGVKLLDVNQVWDPEVITYTRSYMQLWGVAAFFFSLLLSYLFFTHQAPLYILKLMLPTALLFSPILLNMSQSDVEEKIAAHSLYLGIPHYSLVIKIEAALLIAFSLIIIYGLKKGHLTPSESGG